MFRTKLFLAGALALMVTFMGTSSYAQEPSNQITYFTFSAPFELPGGKVLPAGKYVFQIVDSPSNRHIIQVLSEDRKQMLATLLAIPAQRQDPAPEPEVRFMETAANTPPAVRTWWYPGRSVGHEFIYPKDHARRLAAKQKEGVLTVAGDATSVEQMQTSDLARLNASGQESTVAADTTAARATESTTERATPPQQPAAETTTAAAQTTPTPAPRTTPVETTSDTTRTDRARTSLPQTASPLPLFALVGLFSLLGAGALRFGR